MTDKMREVPPITDETYKALMAALGMPNNRSLLSALQQIANHATQRAAWQAAKSVPEGFTPVPTAALEYLADQWPGAYSKFSAKVAECLAAAPAKENVK